MDNQTQANAVQEAIEREVRHLIGDLHMKVIALHTMLGMAQQAQQPGQAPSEPKPQPQPSPIPPQPDQPDKPTKVARPNGGSHEVTS